MRGAPRRKRRGTESDSNYQRCKSSNRELEEKQLRGKGGRDQRGTKASASDLVERRLNKKLPGMERSPRKGNTRKEREKTIL